jgi:hypothetical protein
VGKESVAANHRKLAFPWRSLSLFLYKFQFAQSQLQLGFEKSNDMAASNLSKEEARYVDLLPDAALGNMSPIFEVGKVESLGFQAAAEHAATASSSKSPRRR